MIILSSAAKRLLNLIPFNCKLPILFGDMKGIRWIPKSANPGQFFGRYEPEQSRELIKLFNQTTIFWDVGAHVGWYSVLASIKMKQGTIYSFEPNPKNIIYLKQHIKINNRLNIHAIPYALSSSCGKSYFSGDNQQGHLSDDGIIEVEMITADEYIKETESIPDLIKMDIEGAELEFLKGATKLLTTHKPKLLISAHGHQKRDDCIALLTNLNYGIEHITSNKQDGDYVFLAS